MKNIGSKLALYPTPLTVIGTTKDDKATWTLVAHTGIVSHNHVLVSLAKIHHINKIIKETKKLTINLVNEDTLPKSDYVGSVSGEKTDKSTVFQWTKAENGAPIIKDAPLTMECTVDDIYEIDGFENFICSINNTYIQEEHLTEDEKINYETLKPVLFEFPTYKYLKTGEVLGDCLSFKKEE